MDEIKRDLFVVVPADATDQEVEALVDKAAEAEGDAIAEELEQDFLRDLDGLGSFKP